MSELTLVAGAGGFIGGQLVRDLLAKGLRVRAVDKKPLQDWYFRSPEAENLVADLQLAETLRHGGQGRRPRLQSGRRHGRHGLHREQQARCMLSVLISTHMLHGGPRSRRRALLLLVLRLRLHRRQADQCRRDRRSRKRTPIRPCPRTATAGRSCSPSGCAGISARISA